MAKPGKPGRSATEAGRASGSESGSESGPESGQHSGAAAPFGLLVIDKPAGPTSHDVVGWVRWALRERSVGHCGTLDPAATGLLLVCVGEATKLAAHLTAADKRYLARFVLGCATTTADAEGELLAEAQPPPDSAQRAERALAAMVGPLELPPPAYSAVKLAGRRAHALARAGESPQLAPRPMALHELELRGHGWSPAGDRLWLDAELSVAKGTYVRSLAQELGRRLGLPAHLGSLRRSASGRLDLDHPRCVTGLQARCLSEDRGRGPRWRIELPLGGDLEAGAAREAAGARLRACLEFPGPWLPFPCLELGAGRHRTRFDRLLQGQRLAADADTCAALELSPGQVRAPVVAGAHWALVDRAVARMILVRCEHDEVRGLRLAPARVLRLPPEAALDA